MLECRLTRRTNSAHPFAGLISLINRSEEPYRIEYDLHPLQYLDLRIERDGQRLCTRFYGRIFSAFGGVEVLELGRGETYAANVNLLGNLSPHQRTRGIYRITGEYAYDGSVLSNTIELRID